MTQKPLFCRRFHAINGQGEGRYQRTSASNHNPNARRFEAMTVTSQYGESTPEINPEQTENLQSIRSAHTRGVLS